MSAPCCKPGCARPVRTRKLCNTHYESWRHRQHAYGRFIPTDVDATPVREHLLRLGAAGMGERAIARAAGLNRTTVSDILRPRYSGRPASVSVRRGTAEAILAIAVPGPLDPHHAEGDIVDGTGTVRRLRALVAAGYQQDDLARRLGVTKQRLSGLLRAGQVTARRARAVAALYEAISHVPGPSALARRRGIRMGWPPPLAWDEGAIDDPTAGPADDSTPEPVLDEALLDRIAALRVARSGVHGLEMHVPRGRSIHVPKADRPLYIAALRDRGWPPSHISEALGINGTATRIAVAA